jgi:hypothetical protein
MLCEEFRELKRLAKKDGKDYDYDLNGRVDNLNKAFDFTFMEIDIILKDKFGEINSVRNWIIYEGHIKTVMRKFFVKYITDVILNGVERKLSVELDIDQIGHALFRPRHLPEGPHRSHIGFQIKELNNGEKVSEKRSEKKIKITGHVYINDELINEWLL